MKVVNENFLEVHLAFILTALVTYVLGILFVVVEFISTGESFLKLLLDAVIPTTITYVLGCVLVNIADLLQQNEKSHCIFNIFTCFFVFVYAVVFAIYIMTENSWVWYVIEFVITAMLLFLNICSYREKYKRRNHGLV